jgi:hypothetical protein
MTYPLSNKKYNEEKLNQRERKRENFLLLLCVTYSSHDFFFILHTDLFRQ